MDLEYIVGRTMRFLVFHNFLPFCVSGKKWGGGRVVFSHVSFGGYLALIFFCSNFCFWFVFSCTPLSSSYSDPLTPTLLLVRMREWDGLCIIFGLSIYFPTTAYATPRTALVQ